LICLRGIAVVQASTANVRIWCAVCFAAQFWIRPPGKHVSSGFDHELPFAEHPASSSSMRIADVREFCSVFRNAPEAEEARSGRNSPAIWKADVPGKLDVVPVSAKLNSIKPSTDLARLLDTVACTFRILSSLDGPGSRAGLV
jgi:hypothetical protein